MRKIKLWESEENKYVSQYKNKTVDQLKKEKENLTKQIESYSKKTNPTDTETDKNNDNQERLSAINSVLGTSEISESVEDILVKNTYRKSGYDFRQRLIKNFMKAIESNFDKRYILYTTPIAEDDVPHLEIEVCFDKDSIGKLKYGESFPTICIFHLTYENDKINLYWDNVDGRPIKKVDSLDELVDTVVNKIKKEFKANTQLTENRKTNEAVQLPYVITDWLKYNEEYKSAAKKIATWVEKIGKRITGGTAVGRNPQTLVLDIKYQKGEIRISNYGDTIKLFDTEIKSFGDFKKVWDKFSITESKKPIEYFVYGTVKDGLLGFIDNENVPGRVQPLVTRGQYLGDRTYSQKWLERMYGKGKPATQEDFDNFRIKSEGYLDENVDSRKGNLKHNKWD